MHNEEIGWSADGFYGVKVLGWVVPGGFWRLAIANRPIHRYNLFFVAVPMQLREEIDPLAPQREAALFYGLFLRGHAADALRKDIDVPKPLVEKLMKRHKNEQAVRAKLKRIYTFRKQVLAIFDELVGRERIRERVQ